MTWGIGPKLAYHVRNQKCLYMLKPRGEISNPSSTPTFWGPTLLYYYQRQIYSMSRNKFQFKYQGRNSRDHIEKQLRIIQQIGKRNQFQAKTDTRLSSRVIIAHQNRQWRTLKDTATNISELKDSFPWRPENDFGGTKLVYGEYLRLEIFYRLPILNHQASNYTDMSGTCNLHRQYSIAVLKRTSRSKQRTPTY